MQTVQPIQTGTFNHSVSFARQIGFESTTTSDDSDGIQAIISKVEIWHFDIRPDRFRIWLMAHPSVWIQTVNYWISFVRFDIRFPSFSLCFPRNHITFSIFSFRLPRQISTSFFLPHSRRFSCCCCRLIFAIYADCMLFEKTFIYASADSYLYFCTEISDMTTKGGMERGRKRKEIKEKEMKKKHKLKMMPKSQRKMNRRNKNGTHQKGGIFYAKIKLNKNRKQHWAKSHKTDKSRSPFHLRWSRNHHI